MGAWSIACSLQALGIIPPAAGLGWVVGALAVQGLRIRKAIAPNMSSYASYTRGYNLPTKLRGVAA